jgi:RNA polymerase sigma-70 factor (ECF subfamily)
MTASSGTQPSLLLRIRDPQDARAWSQFAELYAPLIHGFARKYGLQEADAADLTQDVLRLVAQAAKDLDYDPQRGSFRGWLYTVVRNQVRKFFGRRRDFHAGAGGTEAQQRLDQQISPETDLTAEWNAECERRIFAHAAAQIRGDFKEATWQAFWLTAVDGRSGKEVAEQLGMTVAAVYLAKSRVMARLKEQIQLLQAE